MKIADYGERRNSPFVLTTTSFGAMLVNRLDYVMNSDGGGDAGVGVHVLEFGDFLPEETEACLDIIRMRRRKFADGVTVVDVGANYGTRTVPWARAMHGWGRVVAVEVQEPIYYALCGNLILNNCLNVRAVWAAAAAETGTIEIPAIDYRAPGNYGCLSLKIDQPETVGKVNVPAIAIDDMALERLDFLKIDVEGMEMEVLRGARMTIERCRPVIYAETNVNQAVQYEAATIADYAAFVGSTYRCRDADGGSNVLMEPL